MDETSDQLIINGIDITSGDYATPPMSLAEVAEIIQGRTFEPSHLRELRRKGESLEGTLGMLQGDPTSLASAGWGVIFAAGADPAIKEALSPLLKWRGQQATAKLPLFRILDGELAYVLGESKNDYLKRMPHSVGGGQGVAPGPVNPKKLPYYLLLIGGPDVIPFRFQYELDVDYAVGRLSFETVQEYADYTLAVVAAESSPLVGPRRAVFFGTSNPDDQATRLSADHLIKPLPGLIGPDVPVWAIETVVDAAATKQNLLKLLGGDETPSVLFTATHGAVLPVNDPLQARRHGALICQDWPGGIAWRKPFIDDFYVSGDDIAAGSNVKGMIAFFLACYSAGTPQLDDFAHKSGVRRPIVPHDLISALPRRLLGMPGGGALAVVGHIERAWTYSFRWGRAGDQLDVYQSILTQIMQGTPIGAALDVLNQSYASISTMLNNILEEMKFGKAANPIELAGLWTANNDARNFVILGDPAVRLGIP